MAIRMKVNENKNTTCQECGCEWKNTREMIDILLCGKRITICKRCREDLMQKILRMEVKYDNKLKSNSDRARIRNENEIINSKIGGKGLSVLNGDEE